MYFGKFFVKDLPPEVIMVKNVVSVTNCRTIKYQMLYIINFIHLTMILFNEPRQ